MASYGEPEWANASNAPSNAPDVSPNEFTSTEAAPAQNTGLTAREIR